jgi:hypothetical protein
LNRGPSRCKSVTASSYHNRSEPITSYQIFNFWRVFRKPVSGPDRLLEVLICYTFRYTDFRSNLRFVRGTLRVHIALCWCNPTMSSIPQILAKKHVDDAAAARKAAREKLEEESLENRKAYESFYNRLALFSSGTIALSITYLGYLKGIPNKAVMYPRILIASWLVLLACLVASLFYSFFLTHYVYYSRVREYMQKLADEKQTNLDEMDNLPLANTPEELQVARERFAADATTLKGKASFSLRRERVYLWLWTWNGRLARFAFPVGIGLLVFEVFEWAASASLPFQKSRATLRVASGQFTRNPQGGNTTGVAFPPCRL